MKPQRMWCYLPVVPITGIFAMFIGVIISIVQEDAGGPTMAVIGKWRRPLNSMLIYQYVFTIGYFLINHVFLLFRIYFAHKILIVGGREQQNYL